MDVGARDFSTLLMPFGIKNAHETGEALIPGQSDGAPANFNPKRILIRTTILATILFGIYYTNYVNGWISF
jgi:predicted secreted protein